MPFLKKRKISRIDQLVEKTKRNGFRNVVFGICRDVKYVGQWKNDKRHGIGTQLTRNNCEYHGEWANDLRNGFGSLTVNSKRKYIGCWVNGKMQGYGIRWYIDGVYEGEFCKGNRHGYGVMAYNDGKHYKGYWKDDFYSGQGILKTNNGNQYKGEFIKGLKSGTGIYYHHKMGRIQQGVWQGDLCVSSVMEDIAKIVDH